jgi:hypothetical protein
MIMEGEIVNWKQSPSKRLKLEAVKVDIGLYETTVTLAPIYLPAPKSQLKNKSPFSKSTVKIKNL